MITEIAEIEVKPGTEEKFIAGVESCKPIFARAPGFRGLELHHSIEHPQNFVLQVKWDSVAHHMEQFQKSADFALFAVGVGEYLAGKAKLQHTNTVVAI
jgi:heme-degrading monooxygenase HmoA